MRRMNEVKVSTLFNKVEKVKIDKPRKIMRLLGPGSSDVKINTGIS